MQALRIELARFSLVWKKVISISNRPKAIRDLRRNGKLLRLRLNLDARGLGAGRVYFRRAGHSGLFGSDLCRTQRTLSKPAVSRARAGVSIQEAPVSSVQTESVRTIWFSFFTPFHVNYPELLIAGIFEIAGDWSGTRANQKSSRAAT